MNIQRLFILIIFSLIIVGNVFAQTPALVNWQCMSEDSLNVSVSAGHVSGLPVSASPGFVVRDYQNGPGPEARWWPFENGTAVSWGDETNQIDTRWIEFTIFPKTGFEFQCDSVSLYLGAKGTGNLRANVLWSLSDDFLATTQLNDAELSLVKDNDSLYVFPINQTVQTGETLYVRVYPWYTGSPSTSKYVYTRDVTLKGTSRAVAVPVSATWELTDPNADGTGLSVSTAGQLNAVDENLHNMEINHYTGPDESQRVRIAGNEWPALQTEQIDSVYIEFSAAPVDDNIFTVTGISMGIAAASIDAMRANLVYDTNSTFESPTQIDYLPTGQLYLPLDALQEVQAEPNVMIQPGQTFYFRIYPWVDNDPSVRTGKYVCIKNVQIAGTVEGTIRAELPVVITNSVTHVSTTFASCGGQVPSDGGSPVSARGVCWNTESNPDVLDQKTTDGSGTGSFDSQLINLSPNTTYYARAYATSETGTAYGDEMMFTTLASLQVPTVVTQSVSSVMVSTAKSGGQVTQWGGTPVSARGICWNTSGDPTIQDHITENGEGVGSFASVLSDLEPSTTYTVRAYAMNQTGTGYGNSVTFKTQTPAPAITKVVDQSGTGDYTTVQAAFDDIPDFYTGPYTIEVHPGTYYEKLLLDRNKTNVILKGEDPATTILTYDDYAGIAGGTSMCYSVGIDGEDFTAINITFQNTVQNDGSVSDQQGVALRTNGDRQSYYNCRLLGYQDTFYTWGGRGTGRIYLKDCCIEGAVDFIFGRDIVVFDDCEIHINRQGGTLTAAATEPESKFGYVFKNCEITADSIGFDGRAITSFLLGRPWQKAPRTVFLHCEEPAALSSPGWSTWNVTPALYAEYQCYGPGSDASQRISISRQLTDEEAAAYTLGNIFSKSSNPGFGADWVPDESILTSVDHHLNLPSVYALNQNYPNPFNATTHIHYALPSAGSVQIVLYNLAGQQVEVLTDGYQEAGQHHLAIHLDHLASGVYLYRMIAGDFVKTRKLIYIR